MNRIAGVALVFLWGLGVAVTCQAQEGVPPPAAGVAARSPDELDQLLAPIALYPDPLIGIILPAAAQPAQIVMADRYDQNGGDPNTVNDQPWDPSVQGLAHYPTVLKWMDDNIEWTTQLGDAFAVQQSDVMDSIQRLRSRAQGLGNLPSTPQESVTDDNGSIEIDPVNPDEMYVPVYQPDLIYTDPGILCGFGIGCPLGAWLWYDWDWRHRRLIQWGWDHPRPGNWWTLPPHDRHAGIPTRTANVWRSPRAGRSLVVAGGDRAYENRGGTHPTTVTRVAAPRSPAPGAESLRSVPSRPPGGNRESTSHVVVAGTSTHAHASVTPEPSRAPAENRGATSHTVTASAPVATHSAPARTSSTESAFGGSQSANEVRQASARGGESRGSSGGGGSSGAGGGARPSGAGGGGGGGGARAGGAAGGGRGR